MHGHVNVKDSQLSSPSYINLKFLKIFSNLLHTLSLPYNDKAAADFISKFYILTLFLFFFVARNSEFQRWSEFY